MKLIYNYYYCNGVDSWTTIVPFEYESKEKFCFDVYEMWKSKSNDSWIYIFGIDIGREETYTLENNVFTLEEWFELNKKTL